MKTVVAKTEIKTDPKLAIVKAFRIANKRAGEAKRRGEEGITEYGSALAKLKELAELAHANGFDIWVNTNGRTGHTYDKDYKITPDGDNDHAAFLEELAAVEAEANDTIAGALANNLLTTPADPRFN